MWWIHTTWPWIKALLFLSEFGFAWYLSCEEYQQKRNVLRSGSTWFTSNRHAERPRPVCRLTEHSHKKAGFKLIRSCYVLNLNLSLSCVPTRRTTIQCNGITLNSVNQHIKWWRLLVTTLDFIISTLQSRLMSLYQFSLHFQSTLCDVAENEESGEDASAGQGRALVKGPVPAEFSSKHTAGLG